MNSIIIDMQAIPARRHELLQTLDELAALKREQQGFIDSRIRMAVNDRNHFTLIEDWTNRETLHAYMESELFHILRGAVKLLTSHGEISFKPG